MRIREVIARTGLSRRTIQFYIKEGLITPSEDPANGYHDFCGEDVENLLLITGLRRLDFPLSDIRTILQFPSTASYYFYRQMDTLSRRMESMQQSIDFLSHFFEEEPGETDRRALLEKLSLPETGAPPRDAERFTDLDARIIPLFIWSPYLTGARTEYQEFVWEKISRRVIEDYRPFLRSMKRIISSLDPAQLQYSAEQTARQSGEIAALSEEDTPAYALKMLGQIRSFLEDGDLVARWNLVYPSLIRPLLTIGYSDISRMMFELNEEYKRFYDKVCVLCGRIWELMAETEEGRRLHKLITERLLPIDWEENGKWELERMSVFRFTPYAVLSGETLRKIF